MRAPASRPAQEREEEQLEHAAGTSRDTDTHQERSNNACVNGSSGSGTEHSYVSNTNSFTFSSYHKLPRLQMPDFDGEVAERQTFWDSYESADHSNPTLSDIQNFTYLRSLVHGPAASAIAGFPLTHANYSNAIDLLRERFGQPRKIRANYMQSLLDLQRPESSVVGLRAFHDKIETCIRGLESLGQRSDTYGDLLVPIIMAKLPGDVRRNLARDHGGDSSCSLPDLRASTSKEIRILEAGESSDRRGPRMPTATFHTRNEQTHTGSGNRTLKETTNTRPVGTCNLKPASEKIRACVFCGNNHPPTTCDKVTDFKKRKDIVQSNRLCYNCLGKHRVSDCKSANRCRNCKRKHHTAICDNQAKTPLNPEAAPFQTESSRRLDTSDYHGLHLHSEDRPRPTVLLKTAIAEVSSSHYTADAKILFDEGAQRSFISQKLADDLQIQHTGTEAINLATFGGSSQTLRHLPTATVYLRTTGGEKVPLDVMIVPTIAAPLANMPPEVPNFKYLRGLKLAHPVTQDTDFEISFFIGADHYWRIVQNRVVRGNRLTAVMSKIGYLLSGPLPRKPKQTQDAMMSVLTSPPDVSDLEKIWKLESMGIVHDEKNNTSAETLATYQRTTITHADGIYTVELPWKPEHPPPPTNYEITLKPTKNMSRQLSSDTRQHCRRTKGTWLCGEIHANKPCRPRATHTHAPSTRTKGNQVTKPEATEYGHRRRRLRYKERLLHPDKAGRTTEGAHRPLPGPMEVRIHHRTHRIPSHDGPYDSNHQGGRRRAGPRRPTEGDREAGCHQQADHGQRRDGTSSQTTHAPRGDDAIHSQTLPTRGRPHLYFFCGPE